jgi:LysM repeat protein
MNNPKQTKGSPSGPNQARNQVRVVIFTVLAVHVFVLMTLLIEGCRQEPAASNEQSAISNAPAMGNATNQMIAEPTNEVVVASSNPPPVLIETNTPISAPEPITVYTIAAGDTFSKVARTFHTTVNRIRTANPDVIPTSLKIGQKIRIPREIVLPASVPAEALPEGTSNERVYTVRPGDWLLKIANSFGTTVSAIRQANGLQGNKIAAGQKLKIPGASSVSAVTSTAH